MNKYRLAVVRRLDPEALDHPLMKQLIEHQERIANDSGIQARRAAIRRETRRELLPWMAAGTLLQWAGCAALHSYLPGLIDATDAAGLAILSTVISVIVLRPILGRD